jgi:VanZ family protein
MEKAKKIISLWLPVILWSSVIFTFSSQPSLHAAKTYWLDFAIKKTAHMTEYAIYATLLYRALKESGIKKRDAGFFALLIAVLYAFTDEFHQRFTPGREPTIRDTLFDTIGASIAVYTIWNLLPKAPKKLRELAKSLQIL